MLTIARPAADEHIEYYGKYIGLVPEDPLVTLAGSAVTTPKLLAGLSEAQAAHRYAEGKWTVKQVVGHIADAERVFACRALRFARADRTPVPGFDENAYVPAGRFDERTIASLSAELAAVRGATLALARSFDQAALLRRGIANGAEISVRALLWIIAGHELHHVALLHERYDIA